MLQLTKEPKHYPDCCLSLSTDILERVASNILACTDTPDILVLSVGCGTGLFENQLATYLATNYIEAVVKVQGVEVVSARIKHLSASDIHYVHGTWDASEAAENADFLLFVYPREAALVQRYLQTYDGIKAALWLGPAADWADHATILLELPGFETAQILRDAGLMPYELAVLFTRSTSGH